MKTKEVAERLGLDTSTIRVWSGRDYQAFMSESAKGEGRRRHFTERDVQILAYVVEMRDTGSLHDEIKESLYELRDDNWQGLPDVPPRPGHDDEVPMMPRETAQVALSKQSEVLNRQIINLESQITALEKALEEEKEERQKVQSDLIEAKEQLGELRGQLKAIETERKSIDYWLKIIGLAVLVTIIVAAMVVVVLLLAMNGAG